MLARQRRTPRTMQGRTPRVVQPPENAQMPEAHENEVQQRLQQLTTSQKQHADSLTQLHSRLDHLRLEVRETLVDSATTVQTVMQDHLELGHGLGQVRHTLFNVAMEKLEGIDFRFQKAQEQVDHILMATDRKFNEICTTIGRLIDEQGDIRKTVEELAGRMDAMQHGTHPRDTSSRDKISEIRLETLETNSLEAKIGLLEQARSESWELGSNRLNSTLDRTANSLSSRMTELEKMVQSQRTTPATISSQPQTNSEELALIESRIEARYQAFTQDVDQMREE